MEKKLFSLKPNLSAALDKNSSACIDLNLEPKYQYKTLNQEKLERIAEIINKHYDQLEDELRDQLEDETDKEAIYEALEDEIGSAFSHLITHLAYATDPNLLEEI